MRWFLILGGLIALAACALVLWLPLPFSGDRSLPARILEATLADLTGTTVTVGVVSDLDWSNGFGLRVDEIRIGDAGDPIVLMRDVRARIDLMDAVSGNPTLRGLRVAEAVLKASRWAPAWPLSKERLAAAATVVQALEEVGVRHLRVAVDDGAPLRIERLTIVRGALDSLEIDGAIAAPHQPDGPADGVLESVLRGVGGLFDGSGATVQASIQFAASRLSLYGSAVDLSAPDGINLAVSAETNDPPLVAAIAGWRQAVLDGVRRIRLRGRLVAAVRSSGTRGLALRNLGLRVVTADGLVTAAGTVPLLGDPAGTDLSVSARGSDLATIMARFGAVIPATDRFRVSGRLVSRDGGRGAILSLTNLKAAATRGTVRAAVTGGIADLVAGRGLNLDLIVDADDLAAIGPLVGIVLPETGSLKATAALRDRGPDARWQPRLDRLDGRITVPDGTLAVSGTVADPATWTGLALDIAATGGNLDRLSDSIGLPLPWTDHYDIAATVDGSLAEPVLPRLTGTVAIAGVTITGAGRWDDPRRDTGLALTLNAVGDDLTALSEVSGRTLPTTDRFDLSASLSGSAGQVTLTDIDSHVRRGNDVLKARGTLADPFGRPRPDLDLRLTGSDPQPLAETLFGQRIPFLPDMTATVARARLRHHPAGAGDGEGVAGAIGLTDIHVRTSRPGLVIAVRGHLPSLTPPHSAQLSAVVEGDDLTALVAALTARPLDLPPTRRYRLDAVLGGPSAAQASAGARGLSVETLSGRIDLTGADLRVTGRGGDLPDLDGLTLDLELMGEALSPGVLRDLGFDPPPGLATIEAVAGSGRMTVNKGATRLHGVVLTARTPAATIEATGSVGRLPDMAGIDLAVSLSGRRLFDLLGTNAAANLPVTDAFKITGAIRGDRSALHVDDLTLTARRGGLGLTVSGQLSDLRNLDGLTGRLDLAGDGLTTAATAMGMRIPPLTDAAATAALAGGKLGLTLSEIEGTAAIAGGALHTSGRIGNLIDGSGIDLAVRIDGGDVAAVGLPLPPAVADLRTDSFSARFSLQRGLSDTQPEQESAPLASTGPPLWRLSDLAAAWRRGRMRGSLDGEIGDLARFADLDLAIRANAPELRDLLDSAAPGFPRLGQADLSARLTGSTASPRIDIDALRIGASDLSGRVERMVSADGVDQIVMALGSDLVDVTPLLGALREPADRPVAGDGQNDTAVAGDLESQAPSRLSRVLAEGLRVQADWRIGSFAAHDLILDGVRLQGEASLDRLVLRKATARLDGAPIALSIGFDTGRNAATPIDLALSARGLDIGSLAIRSRLVEDIEGIADISVRLGGGPIAAEQAGGFRALAASMSGSAAAILTRARVPDRFADQMPGDLPVVGAALFAGRDSLPVGCAVVHLTLDRGLAIVDRVAIDSDGITIVADGLLDLVNDRVDMQLRPRARNSRLLHAEADMVVTGPLAAPLVAIDKATVPARDLSFVPDFLLDGAGRLRALAGGEIFGSEHRAVAASDCRLDKRLHEAG